MIDNSTPAPSFAFVVGILVLASSTTIMSTDMYAPSLPDLARYFDTTATMVKLTISLNLLAFGIAQLIHGPLSDRFGRRPVLLGSLALVILLSLLCAAAQSIEQLIAARILLGLAAAAEAVIGLAILKDLYNEEQQVKALALFGMSVAIAPAVAPIIGGYLHVAFGWQSNFLVIAAMAAITAVVIHRLLPESTTPDHDALRLAQIGGRYKALLANQEFMVHTAICGVALGMIFVFVTAAPFILIERLGIPVERFGYYSASIVASFFVGSVVASQLADRWDPLRLMGTGVCITIAGALILMLIIALDGLTPVRLASAYSVLVFGMGPLFAVAPSRALRSVRRGTGSASALLSGTEHGMAAVAAVLISVLHDGTAWPMVWVTGGLTVLLVVLLSRSVTLSRA